MDTENIPALTPPEGIKSNFDDPVTLVPAVYGVAITSIVLMTIAVGIRIYTKAFIWKQLRTEDYLVVLALSGFIVWHALIVDICVLGEARHQWDLRAVDVPRLFYLTNIAEIEYTPTMFIAKFSILLQLKHLFCVPHGRNRVWWAITILMGATVVFYFITFFLMIFQCLPRVAIWDFTVTGQCLNAFQVNLGVGVVNMCLDICMLAIPLWSIWQLKLSKEKKIGASAVFGVAFFTIVIAVMGIVYRVLLINAEDATWASTKLGLWTMTENAGTIIVGCFPSVPRFFQHLCGKDDQGSKPSQSGQYSRPGNSTMKQSKGAAFPNFQRQR